MTDQLWNVHLVSDPLGRRFFTTSSKTLIRFGEREKNVEKPARFAKNIFTALCSDAAFDIIKLN
jgi:hypothetical protein